MATLAALENLGVARSAFARQLSPYQKSSLGPRPSFIFGFERAWYAKIRHLTSFWTSVGVSMETPPFTMTSFQSAYGQVAAWCEYSSSETDGRIAS